MIWKAAINIWPSAISHQPLTCHRITLHQILPKCDGLIHSVPARYLVSSVGILWKGHQWQGIIRQLLFFVNWFTIVVESWKFPIQCRKMEKSSVKYLQPLSWIKYSILQRCYKCVIWDTHWLYRFDCGWSKMASLWKLRETKWYLWNHHTFVPLFHIHPNSS